MKSTSENNTQSEHPIRLYRQTNIIETQNLRKKWIIELDDLFDIANLIAKGKVDLQQVGDKLQSITPKERQMWAQVTANIGQVMGNLAKAHDDTQFNDDVVELERLLDEVHILRYERSGRPGSAEITLASKNNSIQK